MHHIHAQNQKLVILCHEFDKEKLSIFQQLKDMKDQIRRAARENMRLQGEVAAVRKALEVRYQSFSPLSLSSCPFGRCPCQEVRGLKGCATSHSQSLWSYLNNHA